MAVDRLENALPRGQGDIDIAIDDEADLFAGVVVERIADDDLQRAVLLRHRQDRVFAGQRLGHQFDDRRRNDDFLEVDEVQPVLLGHCPHHLFAAGIAEADQLVADPLAGFLGQPLGLGQLVGADDAFSDQDVCKIAGQGRHCS